MVRGLVRQTVKVFLALSFFTVFLGATTQKAAAIVLDGFDDFPLQQILLVQDGRLTDASTVFTTSALGGARFVRITRTEGTRRGELEVREGSLFVDTGSDVKARVVIVWDGGGISPSNSTIDYIGLGGVDFTEDGAKALQFNVRRLDFDVQAIIKVFDASDPSGDTFSIGTLSLKRFPDAGAPSNQVGITKLPFVEFAGTAGFDNVGAVSLELFFVSPGTDLDLDMIGTDGDCVDLIPVAGKILDLCGVCGGSNACLDCEDLPFGLALPGTGCVTNLPGVCMEGRYATTCACEPVTLYDECNVYCGSNQCGLVPQECQEQEISQTLALLNRELFTLRDIYMRSLKRYRREGGSAVGSYTAKRLRSVSFRYNWLQLEFDASLPATIYTCPELTATCNIRDITDVLGETGRLARNWRRSTRQTVGRTLDLGVGTATDTKRVQRSAKVQGRVAQKLAEIPKSFYECAQGS